MKLSNEAKVGLFVFIAGLLLAFLVVWKGDVFLRARGYELVGLFGNVGGLTEGAEVRYRGFKVGKVMHVYPNPQETRVSFTVASHIRVPEDSNLRVAFDGLIGQKYIEIVPGISSKNIAPRSALKGFSTLGLVDFLDVGTRNLEESQKILRDVQQLTGDPTVQKKTKAILINLEASTDEISRLVRTMRRSLEEGQMEKLFTLATSVTERFDRISSQIEGITGDPTFPTSVKELVKTSGEAVREFRNMATEVRGLIRKYSR